jgi:hypothetical protein
MGYREGAMKGYKGFGNAIALVLLLVSPYMALAANNRIRTNPGSPITFWDATATVTPTAAFALTGLATNTGQYSARYDKGTGPQAATWRWRCHVQMASAPTAGEVIEVYVSTSDGTNADGQLGTTTAALTSDKRRNLTLVGVLLVDQTSASVTMTASNTVDIKERYFSLALWNATAVNLLTSVNVHGCTMTPMIQEVE